MSPQEPGLRGCVSAFKVSPVIFRAVIYVFTYLAWIKTKGDGGREERETCRAVSLLRKLPPTHTGAGLGPLSLCAVTGSLARCPAS